MKGRDLFTVLPTGYGSVCCASNGRSSSMKLAFLFLAFLVTSPDGLRDCKGTGLGN